MELKFWLQFIGMILLVTVNDIIWTQYITYIGEKKKYKAAFAAMGLTIGGGLIVTQYIDDPRLLIGCVVGAFVGVVLPMTYNERKAKNDKKET